MRIAFFASKLAATTLLASSVAADLPREVSGALWLSDYSNDRVVVYQADGSYSHSFTAPGLNGPRGIAFAPNGRVFVSSQLSNEIFVFEQNEDFVMSFTDPGLAGPTGLAIGPSDELFVSSFSGAFICVFDLDGSYLRAFNAPGFSTPNCVAFDSAGNIYASSASAGAVFKWNAQEQFQYTFTHPSPGGLTSPMGIARDTNDVLYVAGGSSSNIVKFTTDGTYLGELTHPDLTGPQGVAFDDRGHLFSASFFQDKLVEFDASETYVQTITDGALSIPRTIAFQPAVAAARNDANGVNANVFTSTSLPMIGSNWTSEIDVSGFPGTALALVLGYRQPLEFTISVGVILVNVSTAQLVSMTAAVAGNVASFSALVPNDVSLAGYSLSTQGALIGGNGRLTNAIDLVLGTY